MDKKASHLNHYIMLPILSGACWGLAGIFVRELTSAGLDNPTIVFTRTAFGTLLTLLYILISESARAQAGTRLGNRSRSLLYLRPRDLPIVLACGVFGSLLLMPCYNTAVNELTLSLAAILLSTAPVFVLLLGAFLFKEKITSKKVICIIAVLAGCILLSGILEQSAGDAGSFSWNPFGFGMGILSALFNAAFIILSKMIATKGYHSFTVSFWSFLFCSIVLAFFTDWPALLSYIAAAPIGHLFFLLIQSVCTSIIPSVAYIVAMRHVEAGRVAILQCGAEPTAAFIAGLIIYAEIPTIAGLAGMVITIIALMILAGDRG